MFSTLAPFYPDRTVFGSKALKDYLSHKPDAFELTNFWHTGDADDFRVTTFFNINRLDDGFKLAEPLVFMSISTVGCPRPNQWGPASFFRLSNFSSPHLAKP